MKIFCALLLFSNSLLFANVPKVAVAEIKLTGSRDKVLSFEQRSIVLEVADIYLNRSDEFFTASLEGLKNPYASKPDLIDDEELKIEKTATVYDTASILEVIGANFARQVRGTLSKGGIDYLQLQGGSLMAAGSSFPAEIPQIKDQSFRVTIFDVNSRGYTLKIKDTILEVSFEISSGVTKD